MSSAPFPIYQLMENWAAHAYGTPEVRAHHHALYYALLNLVKTKGGLTRFSLAYGHGMECSGIGSKATYLTALRELQAWGFVNYTPGENRFVLPIIEVTITPSTGPLLALYRTSIATSTDTSTGRNKEVVRLKVEVDEKAAALAEALADVELLKAELAALTESPTDHRPTIVAVPAAPEKAAAIATTDLADEILWSDSPLSRSESFKIICERHTFGKGIAHEHYRQLALAAVEGTDTARTIKQWQSWIFKFLENQKPKVGHLLTPADLASELQTGVRAPQSPDAPNHKRRPEVQAQYDAKFQADMAARIAANFANRASETGGSAQQPGTATRGF